MRVRPTLFALALGFLLTGAVGCSDDDSSDANNNSPPTDGTVSMDTGPGPDAAEPDAAASSEICDNGADDDGDGQTDCADPDCYDSGAAEPGAMAGMTAEHNKVRCAVGSATGGLIPLLTWSPTLATYAQNWADTLAGQGCPLQHSGGPYGENIYWSSGMSPSPADVVGAWESEISCFSYGTFPGCCSCTCGHYTQIVWRNTTAVGCGMATCGSEQIWVCSYDPPGNYGGQPPY